MSDLSQWFVFDVNPYPWKVPPFSAGRKGNKIFPIAGRDTGLHSYKEAIREQLAQIPHWKIEGPVDLKMWFYRNVPAYTTQAGRTARKHDADTTNLQKAAEDALQGYLFDNDKDVVQVESFRVEQSPDATGLLVVMARPHDKFDLPYPDEVLAGILEIRSRYNTDYKPMTFGKPEDIPF